MAVNNESRIVQENEDLIQHTLREFNVPESIREDLLQEGRIGVLKAARAWQKDRGAQFRTYATTVVRNAMIDFLRMQRPTFESMDEVRSDPIVYVDGSYTRHDVIGLPATQENAFFAKERSAVVHSAVARLESRVQRDVLRRRLAGGTAEDIAVERGTQVRAVWKTIDEAIPHLRERVQAKL